MPPSVTESKSIATSPRASVGPYEAGKMLNVVPTTVQRWVDAGYLRAYRTAGGHRRIAISDLEEFAREKGMPIEIEKASPEPCLLMIDDDQDVIETLKSKVAGLRPELKLVTASSGFQAGYLIREHRPKLVLLDIRMPGLNGVEVCRLIMGNDPMSSTRVIAITAFRDVPAIEAIKKAGAVEVLFKPFETDQLLRILEEHFPKARRGM